MTRYIVPDKSLLPQVKNQCISGHCCGVDVVTPQLVRSRPINGNYELTGNMDFSVNMRIHPYKGPGTDGPDHVDTRKFEEGELKDLNAVTARSDQSLESAIQRCGGLAVAESRSQPISRPLVQQPRNIPPYLLMGPIRTG